MKINSEFVEVSEPSSEKSKTASTSYRTSSNPDLPSTGDDIELYWDLDNQFYIGTVS